MDRVQNQVTSIRSDLKEQIDQVVQEVKTELRTEFKAALDKKGNVVRDICGNKGK